MGPRVSSVPPHSARGPLIASNSVRSSSTRDQDNDDDGGKYRRHHHANDPATESFGSFIVTRRWLGVRAVAALLRWTVAPLSSVLPVVRSLTANDSMEAMTPL